MKRHFDLGVIIPLEEELLEFQKIFPVVENLSTDTQAIFAVQSGSDDISIVAIQQEAMGKASASSATSYLLDHYDITVMVCLGIAGAISTDLSVCDVCYTGTVIDVIENTKTTDLDGSDLDLELSPTQFFTERSITAAFSFMRTFPDLRPQYEKWQAEQAEVAKSLLPQSYKGRDGRDETVGTPKTFSGSIACGMVSKSKTYNKKLLALDRKLLAIETESGGVFERALARNIPAIAIRGISDYADKDKSSLEAGSKGKIRALAASNAASFFRMQLANPQFRKHILDHRQASTTPFLRVNLAAHLMKRVYWEHWQKEDRLALLDAAEEALQPLQISVNKSETKRAIERSDSDNTEE